MVSLFSGKGISKSSKYFVNSSKFKISVTLILSADICFSKGVLSNVFQSSFSFSGSSLNFFLFSPNLMYSLPSKETGRLSAETISNKTTFLSSIETS